MKAITSLTAGMFLACVALVSTSEAPQTGTLKFEQDVLISCLWITYCGDPDVYSPVPQPKDKTIDTQDKDKDSKVA